MHVTITSKYLNFLKDWNTCNQFVLPLREILIVQADPSCRTSKKPWFCLWMLSLCSFHKFIAMQCAFQKSGHTYLYFLSPRSALLCRDSDSVLLFRARDQSGICGSAGDLCTVAKAYESCLPAGVYNHFREVFIVLRRITTGYACSGIAWVRGLVNQTMSLNVICWSLRRCAVRKRILVMYFAFTEVFASLVTERDANVESMIFFNWYYASSWTRGCWGRFGFLL